MVGSGWDCFTTAGSAEYGFYDDMWSPVVQDGAHSQLIEINTKQYAASEPKRFAGIYQVVRGLQAGETYEFSMWGQMREEASHPDEDPYRYRVEWGYAPLDATPSPADITNWVEVPWDTIYPRIEPGEMASYAVKVQAPCSKMVLGIRAWKKWGTSYRELDVNLDAVSLVRCEPMPAQVVFPFQGGEPWNAPPPEPLKPPESAAQPDGCSEQHVVARGDTLHELAKDYSTSVELLVDLNQIADPNLIYVGQTLCVSPN
jgi:hypothetical protein